MGLRFHFLIVLVSLLGFILRAEVAGAAPRVYHVAANAAPSGLGTLQSPFSTISEAMRQPLKPGDSVVVHPGIYRESVYMSKNGAPGAPITLRSAVFRGARIRPPANDKMGIQITGNYVTVSGFDVAGSKRSGIGGSRVHHVRVMKNYSHHNGTGGIFFMESDFLHIEGNATFANASSSYISGISILHAQNITNNPEPNSYRIIIRNNVSHSNIMKIPGMHTDGHGVIIDRFRGTLGGLPPYTFPVLIDGNVVFNNGGSGINIFNSDNVMVRNNTAFRNNVDLQAPGGWRGELQNSLASHIIYVNNIAVADPEIHPANKAFENASTKQHRNIGVHYFNNLSFNGTPGDPSVFANWGGAIPSPANGNLLGVNPRFGTQVGQRLRIQPGSPAIDRGTVHLGIQAKDLDGHPRRVRMVDIGAFEVQD